MQMKAQVKSQVKHFVSKTYFNQQPLTERDYTRGRGMFIIDGCSANGILAMTSGAFLSGYLSSLGADDSINGIVGSIPTLVCVVQLFSSVVLENLREKKFLIAMFAFLHRLLMAAIFFVPFLVNGKAARFAIVITLFAISHCCGTFIGTGASNWLMQLINNKELGRYLGMRDAFGLATTTFVSLVMGNVLDRFRSIDQEQRGFLMVGAAVLALAFVNFYCLSSIKEPVDINSGKRVKLKQVLIEPLKHAKFRKVILFFALWNVALQVAGPFFSVYMVTGLKLDYTYIMLIGLISSVARVLAGTFWGKMADKRSWLWLTKSSMLILGIIHISWMFMTRGNYMVLQPILQAGSGIAWGGIAISMFNLPYIYAPAEFRVMYVSANAAYAGIIGFSSTLIGATLLVVLKPFYVGGLHITTMQSLFAISGLLIIGCVFYIKKVLERES